MYEEGEIVLYYKNKIYKDAKIIKVHNDDIENYYTIEYDNKEIQTIEKYIKKKIYKLKRIKKNI
jgi:hypothetical protein